MSDKEMAVMLLDMAKARFDEAIDLLDMIKKIDEHYFDDIYESDLKDISHSMDNAFFDIEKSIRYWG